jgi:hypothetical protein
MMPRRPHTGRTRRALSANYLRAFLTATLEEEMH